MNVELLIKQAFDEIVKLRNRVAELEANEVHIHPYEVGDIVTGEPLVVREDNEGREVWVER